MNFDPREAKVNYSELYIRGGLYILSSKYHPYFHCGQATNSFQAVASNSIVDPDMPDELLACDHVAKGATTATGRQLLPMSLQLLLRYLTNCLTTTMFFKARHSTDGALRHAYVITALSLNLLSLTCLLFVLASGFRAPVGKISGHSFAVVIKPLLLPDSLDADDY
jgi:hypothetical protein